MQRQKLTVEIRKVFGKKLKKLRKEDILPANIYGRDIKSVAVQLPYKDFEKAYKEAGETGLIDIQVDGELRPSLIHNVQQDYYKHTLLHADFFQVNLKEKVKTMVKIIAVGVPKAVFEKLGLLLQPLSEVEVEALPTDLPDKIEVNVQPLAEVDAQITVSEIKLPTGVTILTDASQVVAKIGSLISKEAAEQAAAETAAAQAAKAAAAPTLEEGETAAPGEGAPKVEGEIKEAPQAATKPGAAPAAAPSAPFGNAQGKGLRQAKPQK